MTRLGGKKHLSGICDSIFTYNQTSVGVEIAPPLPECVPTTRCRRRGGLWGVPHFLRSPRSPRSLTCNRCPLGPPRGQLPSSFPLILRGNVKIGRSRDSRCNLARPRFSGLARFSVHGHDLAHNDPISAVNLELRMAHQTFSIMLAFYEL